MSGMRRATGTMRGPWAAVPAVGPRARRLAVVGGHEQFGLAGAGGGVAQPNDVTAVEADVAGRDVDGGGELADPGELLPPRHPDLDARRVRVRRRPGVLAHAQSLEHHKTVSAPGPPRERGPEAEGQVTSSGRSFASPASAV